ncbi:MAG: hypothetical protein HYZ53_30090 [Planctomycetes bacterium]|nr:hypothetical protein [Planctomycetota bacterium]
MTTPRKVAESSLLRHAIATLAYRATRAIKGGPAGFPDFEAGKGARTPRDLLSHMANDIEVAVSAMHGNEYEPPAVGLWETELARFYTALRQMDELLVKYEIPDHVAQALIQGPVTDVLAHIGQLALLRRLAGAPMPGENYMEADVEEGRVGPDQPPPAEPL